MMGVERPAISVGAVRLNLELRKERLRDSCACHLQEAEATTTLRLE